MHGKSRLFERIERLYDVGLIGQAKVLVAGCGSGGSQVALQLAMSGIRNFVLYDNQTLGEENVIRHACGLRYVDGTRRRPCSIFSKTVILISTPSCTTKT